MKRDIFETVTLPSDKKARFLASTQEAQKPLLSASNVEAYDESQQAQFYFVRAAAGGMLLRNQITI
jgi:hypothetical protein